MDIIPEIIKQLVPHIGYIDIYYSYFLSENETEQPKSIGIYFKEELKKVSAVEFLDLIEGSYPAICCHAHLKMLKTSIDQTRYMIDDCPSLRPSAAIEQVIKNPFTKFLFKGDKVNYAISTSDLLCRYIDDFTFKNSLHLNQNLVNSLDFKNCKTTYIGTKWLRDIKPSKNEILKIAHKYPHPIFFFFPDSEGAFGTDSKKVLEYSRLFNLALDKASEFGGTVKFFEPADQFYIEPGDFLVVHNELSRKKIKELKELSCQGTTIDANYFEQNGDMK